MTHPVQEVVKEGSFKKLLALFAVFFLTPGFLVCARFRIGNIHDWTFEMYCVSCFGLCYDF